MQLPHLQHPEQYGGLYVVEFGDFVNVGYTAEEVAMLLESEQYRNAKVYRIHRAYADGRLELAGVQPKRFGLASGVLFYRRELADARKDYDSLRRLAEAQPPPCRVRLALSALREQAATPYATLLAYAAKQDGEVSAWLLEHHVAAGDAVEGGPAALAAAQADGDVIESTQLEAAPGRRSRSREEVLAAVGDRVQRLL
jgi:hypothetical protein